jgi:hypothetical protein
VKAAALDWPLIAVLAVVFVVMSWVRWRWFRARFLRRQQPPPVNQAPPAARRDDDAAP